MDAASADAAGVVLNTLVTDTHLEFEPTIDPSTSADSQPITIETGTSNAFPVIASETKKGTERPPVLINKPLPDMRHEQTYLAAIARTDGSFWSITRVTLTDFLIWPTIMQFGYVLGLDCFRYLRTGSTRSGRQFGLIIRDFLNIGGILD